MKECEHRECDVSVSEQTSTCKFCGYVRHVRTGQVGNAYFMDYDWNEDLK